MIAGMRELGHLDVMLDIHQDEEKPYVFISKTPLGVPSCTPELRKRREKFHEVLRRRSSCFETPGPVDPVGYPVRSTPNPQPKPRQTQALTHLFRSLARLLRSHAGARARKGQLEHLLGGRRRGLPRLPVNDYGAPVQGQRQRRRERRRGVQDRPVSLSACASRGEIGGSRDRPPADGHLHRAPS